MGKKANSENADQSSEATVAQVGGGVGRHKVETRNGKEMSNFAHLKASLMAVDGSSGFNELQKASTTNAQANALDLTQSSVLSRVKNFSSIDLTGTINNTIKLNWEAVCVLADNGAVAAPWGVNPARMVVVSGNAGDALQLVHLSNWTVGAVQTAEALIATYGHAHQFLAGHQYQAYSLRGATVYIDAAITVHEAPGTQQGTQLPSQAFSIEQLFGPQASEADARSAWQQNAETTASDIGSFKGVAIVFAGTGGPTGDTSQRGHYELSQDGGISWMPLAGNLTDATAIYADKTALLRYVGAQDAGGIQPQKLYVRYMHDLAHSEDTFDGAGLTGRTLDVAAHGVSTAPLSKAQTALAATNQVVTGPDFYPVGVVGSPVNSLFGGGEGDATKGIAITSVDKSQGALFYSTNGGQTWTEVTDQLDAQNALFLRSDADNMVYFKPIDALKMRSADALTIRAWDQSEKTELIFFGTTEEELHPNADQASLAVVGEKEDLSNFYSLNEVQSVDLSRVMGVKDEQGQPPADLARMAMGTDSSAKGLPLSLADVLDVPAQKGTHQLVLTGEVEAKLVLTESDWIGSTDVRHPNGHDYTANAGPGDRTAQWLIDQQLLQSQQSS